MCVCTSWRLLFCVFVCLLSHVQLCAKSPSFCAPTIYSIFFFYVQNLKNDFLLLPESLCVWKGQCLRQFLVRRRPPHGTVDTTERECLETIFSLWRLCFFFSSPPTLGVGGVERRLISIGSRAHWENRFPLRDSGQSGLCGAPRRDCEGSTGNRF